MLTPCLHSHLFVVTFTLFVTGCGHLAQYKAKPVSLSSSAERRTSHSLSAKTWTLSQLVAEAQVQHPDVQLAKAQYESSRAAWTTASERPNPTITVGPQIVTPFRLNAGSYALDFDWQIETAHKRNHRMAQAQALSRAAAQGVAEASWKVRAGVRKALLELKAGEEKRALLDTVVTQQSDIVKAMEQRAAAGELSRTEVMQSRLLLTQYKLQVADAVKASTISRAALAESMGMSVTGLTSAKLSFATFDRMPDLRSAASLRKAAMTRRADVLAALADYAAAECALQTEISKQYPDIHLNPGYQFDAGVNKWAIGFTITPPLLNRNKGPIAEAEAKRSEAAAKLDAAQAKALADVERALAGVEAAKAKLEVTQGLLSELDKALNAANQAVKEGAVDRLASLAAQLERDAAKVSQLDAHLELQQALGDLEAATQSDFTK